MEGFHKGASTIVKYNSLVFNHTKKINLNPSNA